MPQIKIERVLSFTSEDPTHNANNILSTDSSKKWKCKTAGEQSASVVLQLDQPYNINGIDIGNENSAYVEVLVARSSTPEDFKVLLVMSSFMSPIEARQSQNINKVRMFKQADLSQPERDEKWDRVKIVCTQPFNRHLQYGLSFVNLYYSDGKSLEKPKTQTTIGKFTLRPESPDNISIGSLFARKKLQPENSGELKGAAAIREATALAHTGSPATKKINLNLPKTPKLQQKITNKDDDDDDSGKKRQERHRNELLYSKDEEDKHDKIDKLIKQKEEEKQNEEEKETILHKQKDTPSKVTEKKKGKTPKKTPVATTSTKPETPKPKETLKRKHDNSEEQKIKKPKKIAAVKPLEKPAGKPFAKLLEDVVFIISGIQNPDRASLRSMALSMGAKYKKEWDGTCTHLICAFANTPKFNQVKGKGKIVKRNWIDECYNQRKKLPWRRFALDKADRGPESEEEICEQDDSPIPAPNSPPNGTNSDLDDDTREQGSDTEEKIAKLMKKQAEPKCKKHQKEYCVDTDSELMSDHSHNNLEFQNKFKDFFENKIFYVDEQLDKDLVKTIKQYIVAYNGILVEDLEVSIDFIVTNTSNYKTFKDLYPSALCVAPDWIWECHNLQKLMPTEDFIFA
ncbi:unnamed protein product [Ceutorhynchus assimilis]|uniref:BRCT domain-containing protein n=1 Tax=Ceutorhynchus assimilis TaxID=467358 RepID=A0A9N9QRQ2_9CUCU|nr:unnamed protein product [Ceutorhynchus assimilis]